ncbi:hypothetical protein RJP56_16680 [Shewanella baltica]|uniref:hypothetical protein n=1 Tax=Shewanella baltica TaxID=62322 RepID=UPI0028724922|nr:hypothetical protein [Shewanella baltica]MDR9767699.1 hypothetical protein [Shewanella baltica]
MLLGDVNLNNGIEVKDAIHVINSLSVNKDNRVSFRVDIFVDMSHPAIDNFYSSFIYKGGDIKKEAELILIETGKYRKQD